MNIPWLAVIVAAAAVLWLMTRKGRHFQAEGIYGGLAITLVVAVIAGWWLDSYTNFTVLLKWGLNGGTALSSGTAVYLVGVGVAFIGMIASAYKAGQFVS